MLSEPQIQAVAQLLKKRRGITAAAAAIHIRRVLGELGEIAAIAEELGLIFHVAAPLPEELAEVNAPPVDVVDEPTVDPDEPAAGEIDEPTEIDPEDVDEASAAVEPPKAKPKKKRT